MRRPRLWTLCVCGFFLALPVAYAVPASAQSFGPIFSKQYVRAAGTPVSTIDTFTACDPSGTFRLVVLNGPDESGRIITDAGELGLLSSGSIVVNGVEVIGERDFGQNVSQIDRALAGIDADNRLEVRLRSGPAAAIRVTVEAMQRCGIQITTPSPGVTLDQENVLVRGTVNVPPSGAVGVTVNGVAGLVEGHEFVAVVPVDPTVVALTAVARDFSGTLGIDSVAVTVDEPSTEPALRLLATVVAGIVPVSTQFELSSTVPVDQVQLDSDGDGTVDFQGPLAGQAFTYARPGIYVPRARAVDDQGVAHTAETIIQAFDPVGLDINLQAVWNGLKDALRGGDVTRAGDFLHSETRQRYQTQFARLGPAILANIDQIMTTISLVGTGFGGAEYEMLRTREGDVLSFPVWFGLDGDGLWRLRRF
jgi:hypothetical protein